MSTKLDDAISLHEVNANRYSKENMRQLAEEEKQLVKWLSELRDIKMRYCQGAATVATMLTEKERLETLATEANELSEAVIHRIYVEKLPTNIASLRKDKAFQDVLNKFVNVLMATHTLVNDVTWDFLIDINKSPRWEQWIKKLKKDGKL